MIKNKDSLKAKVSNLSKEANIPNKYIIQEFMFEALLRRISISKYKEKFVSMELERKKAIEDEIEKIKLKSGELVSTMDVPNTIRIFGDESSHIKRGHNIFLLSNENWTEVATILSPHLSHSYFISKLMEHASSLDIKIYENGILLKEDGEQRIIAIMNINEHNQIEFKILSSHSVVPSTFIFDIESFLKFMSECEKSQPKSAKAIASKVTGFNGHCLIDAIVYNDTPLTDDSEGENIYHLTLTQELGTENGFDQLDAVTPLISCTDTNKALEISKAIIQGKVLKK